MRVPILMPQLGESIAEATVRDIKIKVGQKVKTDEDVLEVETEKAMMEVTTPCSGEVLEVTAELDVSYPVGAILGYLEANEETTKQIQSTEKPENTDKETTSPIKRDQAPSKADIISNVSVTPTIEGLPVPAKASGARYISPRLGLEWKS